MKKPVVGLLAGLVFGLLDGATAWFTPAVRNAMVGILIGSSFKGMVVGLLAGCFALRVQSIPKGVALGSLLGLLFAYAVASQPAEDGRYYYLEIMLPGFITGGIIGFLTQVKGHLSPASQTKS